MDYDLIIVGGGPAGVTLARLLANKCRILVIERRKFTSDSDSSPTKCCGGLIAPDAQRMLAALGIGMPKEILVTPQLFSVRTVDCNSGLIRHYQRHYLNCDRNLFDRWLLSLVPPSVDIAYRTSYLGHDEERDGVIVRYTEGGLEKKATARFIAGTDGAMSRVRKICCPGIPVPRRYLALQLAVPNRDGPFSRNYGAIFDNRLTDFYGWTIPKNDCIVIGLALPWHENKSKGEYTGNFSRFIDSLRLTGLLVNETEFGVLTGAFINRPCGAGNIVTGRGRTFLAVEAAGFISPSSAEGISYAFSSSVSLAQSLAGHFSDEAHWKLIQRNYYAKTLKLKLSIVLKNGKSPFIYTRLFRELALRSGLLSIRPVDNS